jgi:RHS repeat-associated protein
MQGRPDHKFQYNGKEKQEELGLHWLNYEARMYDAQLGRFHTIDPLADIQEGFTPYHYVYNNPLKFADPTGLFPEGNQRIASTFVGPDGTTLDHRDDGDPSIYYVKAVDEWVKNGKKKDGLSRIGWENPDYDYQVGKKYNRLDKKQNLFAPASGAVNADYTLESLFIPLARPIGWGTKFAGSYILRLVNKGGKWIFEVVEQGTNKVIGSFAAKSAQTLESQLAKKSILGFTQHGTDQMVSRGFTPEAIMKIISEGTIETVVYRGQPQIHYVLGQYRIATAIGGQQNGKIISVMGDYNTIISGVRGVFTGF